MTKSEKYLLDRSLINEVVIQRLVETISITNPETKDYLGTLESNWNNLLNDLDKRYDKK